MRYIPLFAIALLAACASTRKSWPKAQEALGRVAARQPDLVRLTLHAVPQGRTECTQIASTIPERRGKPSDPEDLEAMRTGRLVVLDEPGALDVTVPILLKGGSPTAIAGVTLRAPPGFNRTALTKRAQLVAADLAAEIEKAGKPLW